MNTLGKYQNLEKLGAGAFGTVYKALDPTLQRLVAIKVLHPLLASNKTVVARFQREAIAIARFRHPHIVLVYEAAEFDSMPALVMEYVAGDTLDKVIPAGGMTLTQAVPLIEKIAEALGHAHVQGMLHRDVKPSNILVERDSGRVVLTDFGLAKLNDLEGVTGSSGGMIGTPEYIAPELWDDGVAIPASDVYALACVVYEMLTGKVLFAASKPAAVMKKHMLEGANLEALTNRRLRDALAAALHMDPGQRIGLNIFTNALCAEIKYLHVITLDIKTEPEKAIVLINEAIDLNPTSPDYWFFRGECHSHKKMPENAITDIRQAIELRHNQFDYWKAFALVIAYDEDIERIFAYANKGIELHPNNPSNWMIRSLAYVFKQDFNNAFSDASKAIEINPKDPFYWFLRAYGCRWLFKQEDFAIADITRAIELNPDNPDWWVFRSDIYITKEIYNLAIDDISKAIQLCPNNFDYWWTRQNYYAQTENWQAMVEAMNSLILLFPKNGKAYLRRASAYQSIGNIELAIEDINKAIQLCPNNLDYWWKLQQCYEHTHNWQAIVEAMNNLILLFPKNEKAYWLRGSAYQSTGNIELADVDKAKAKELGYFSFWDFWISLLNAST